MGAYLSQRKMEAAKKIAILANPKAGTGRAPEVAGMAAAFLAERNLPYAVFKDNWPGDTHGFAAVWLAGGDGTIQYFLNRYPENTRPVGLLPAGTGNDFYWMLHGSRPLTAQFEALITGQWRAVDTGRCNGVFFANGVGAGFEGAVAKSLQGRQKLPGKASYLITILKLIFGYKPGKYHITFEGGRISGRMLLVNVSNGRRAGGGFLISPLSDAFDGLLDVVIAGPIGPLKRLRYLPVMEKGRHLHLPFIQHVRTPWVCIESDTPILYHMDGEYGTANKLEVAVRSGGLKVLG